MKNIFILYILFNILNTQQLLPSPGIDIILLTSDNGIQISNDNGSSWKELNNGLPEKFIQLKIYAENSGKFYLLTKQSGIFEYDPETGKWKDINSASFKEPGSSCYRKISAFAHSGKCILATKHELYQRSQNGSWTRVNGFSDMNYCTSLAFTPENEIYAGTSYSGIFKLTGNKSINISSNLPKESFSKDRHFYEEIGGIACDETNGRIFAGMNFSGDVCVTINDGKSWSSLKFPVNKNIINEIYDIKYYNNRLFVSSNMGIFKLNEGNIWEKLSFNLIDILQKNKNNLAVLISEKSGEIPSLFYKLNDYILKDNKYIRAKAAAKKAIYANAYSLNKKLAYYANIMKKCGFNAIVIDMKDDWGDLCFSSENKTALEIKNVKKYMDADKIIKHFRKEKIYTIARIVVFKDKRLYEAYDNKYAIWNRKTNKPWKGNAKEFWVDPFSEYVRNYNIEIATELENIGFDEIQFDYIRFPSDGPIWQCEFRHKKYESIYKSEILAEFLKEAKAKLKVAVSADIYGFNAWFRFGNVIGQDAEMFSGIVDALCPMIYPSHYGKAFYSRFKEDEKPYRIVFQNMKRAEIITSGNAIIRPYIQAFNLLSPTWGPEYIRSQVKAVEDAGFDGFTFWNAGGDYDMVKKMYMMINKKNI